MTNLAQGTTTFSLTGAPESVSITANGTLALKLWAGGGGSGSATAVVGRMGGGSAFVTATFNVLNGDVIKFEIGAGGQSPRANTGLGGQPGYPDGGWGGRSSSSTANSGAGGGGSTRVYINGTLIAVCGAGGGSHSANAGATGGPGGATTGGAGVGTAGRTGAGGTQAAGGLGGGSTAARSGASLLGGNGTQAAPISSGLTSAPGGGGGGGFFGGGGGNGNTSTQNAPGGGGSSWVNTAHAQYVSSTKTDGAINVPGGSTDPAFVVGIGRGGDSNTTTFSVYNGGPGSAVVVYSVGTPASTSGDVGTITISGPAGAATGTAAAAPSVPTINLTAPAGAAGVPAGTSGSLGPDITVSAVPAAGAVGAGAASPAIDTITVSNSPGTEVATSVTIIQPLLDYDINVSAPDAGATGGVDRAAALATIQVTPPIGYVPGAAFTLDFAAITLSAAPEAAADVVYYAPADTIPAITLSAPDVSLVRGQNLTKALPAAINVSSPLAIAALDDAVAFGDIGEITVTTPEGEVEAAVEASGDLATITLSTNPEAGAVGGGHAVGTDFPQRVVGAPTVTVTHGQVFTVDGPGEITVVRPEAIAKLAAIIHASIASAIGVSMGTAVGRVYAAPDVGDIPAISVLAPDVEVLEGTIGFANIGTIVVAAGAAAAMGAVETTGDLATIDITAPEGEGGDGISASASGSLPVITVSGPEAWVENGAFGKLLFKRTQVAGRAPAFVLSREIALNEADGTIFFNDPAGNLAQSSYLALSQGAFAPAGGSVGQVLLGDGSWGDAAITYTAPVRAQPPKTRFGELIILSEGVLGLEAFAPVRDTSLIRPFFVPKAIRLTRLGVRVVIGGSNTAQISVRAWDPATHVLGSTFATVAVDCSATGSALQDQSVILAAGWYASVLRVIGTGLVTLEAAITPATIDSNFNLTDDHAFVVAETEAA